MVGACLRGRDFEHLVICHNRMVGFFAGNGDNQQCLAVLYYTRWIINRDGLW